MAIDVPAPTASHETMIAARIALSVMPPVKPFPLQTETAIAGKIARKDSRHRGRSIRDVQPKDSPKSRSSAPRSVPGAPVPDPAPPRSADPVYYPARQLDVYPTLLYPVRPDYPEQLLQRNAHGKVRVTLLIDETGSVNEVSMVEAEPAGYFEHAVRKAA